MSDIAHVELVELRGLLLSAVSDVKQVLLADDSLSDIELLRMTLEKTSVAANLHVVHDGDEVLSFLRCTGRHSQAPPIDLLLMEIGLPRRSGPQVLAELQRDHKLRSLPKVLWSASATREEVHDCQSLGADVVLEKPAGTEETRRVIERLAARFLARNAPGRGRRSSRPKSRAPDAAPSLRPSGRPRSSTRPSTRPVGDAAPAQLASTANKAQAIDAERRGDWCGAAAAWRDLSQRFPADPLPARACAVALFRSQGSAEDVLEHARRAVDIAAHDPLCQSVLAFAYVNLDRPEKAKQVLRQVLALSPDDPDARRNLARLGR